MGPDFIRIGKISGASGLRGEIKLFHDSGERERIAGIEELFLSRPICGGTPKRGGEAERSFERLAGGLSGARRAADGGGPYRVEVLSMRYTGKTPILRVRGVETREAAESLIGALVYARKGSLAPLDEGSYFVEDLAGLEVVDEGGGRVGEVAGIIDNPAHDILRIAPGAGGEEILLPMVDEFVLSVAPGDGRIVVRLPDGIGEIAVRRHKKNRPCCVDAPDDGGNGGADED
ncbi:MAG: ribosome maturation factor RimM [Clostridiales Family XIII bacterium]|nr:ribosome maturation factor RimM [Clostridiales Family XIII bacterium]